MSKSLLTIIFLIFTRLCFSQNINFIIQVNDKLLQYGELANLYLIIENEKDTTKYFVNYYPGDLILSKDILAVIDSAKYDKIYLHFDYYTYRRGKQDVANFDIELSKNLFKKPYLIANVFDFRDKKYKRWYQYHTEEKYLVQMIYPNSGLYVRRK
ncbi:hypothetical protein M0M57_02060 [Flavobacterium azooxidireducens]|uniref:Uncharacterized protein n=1 Tax=Flavobacterium azooxidireducens TaxID=1871076 RepID=A0ABY4KGE8_9FLAO|nr:hypothetical protein [Flavobacterium azooxidireducens]UPQ79634.1 hypothetical protein M0M57_02060 [Flavobacterium azooxidireducens]